MKSAKRQKALPVWLCFVFDIIPRLGLPESAHMVVFWWLIFLLIG